jgi:hypothetical protein
MLLFVPMVLHRFEKKSLANVPDMKGLELASKFLLKNHIMVMKMPLIRFQLWT